MARLSCNLHLSRVGRGVANRFRRAINIFFRFSNINNKLPFNSLTIPTRDRELRTIPTIMSQLSAPLLSRPRLPRTSQEQVSNKRGREDSTDVVPPMREPNQKKKKTDFRGFCDFDTDYLRSDDDEDFDAVESESEYGSSPLFETSHK